MKFQDFFLKNYKLIKLNFILLGTFIFFLVLQLGQQSYAVTDDDLSMMGLTTAEWAEEVIRYNNISMSTPFIVWRSWDYDKEAVHTYVYTYPDLSPNMLLTFSAKSSRMLMNFTSNTDLTNIQKSDFVIKNSNDILHVVTYDYDLNGHSFTNKYEATWTENTITFNSGTIEEFTLDNNIRLGNYAVSDVNKGLEYIQYTNFNSYYLNYIGIKNFDESKKLEIYDYSEYIICDSDEFGDYIVIDSSIKYTNVSYVIFSGDNLMDGLINYNLDVSVNLNTFKLYINDSSDVNITFYDSSDKILYETTKSYDHPFNYSSCVIYGSDVNGDYIILDEKLKISDVYYIVFQGEFSNWGTNNFICSTLDDFSLVKLYSDYIKSVIVTMYGADGIIWSNVNDLVDYSFNYKFDTYFEYYDNLQTSNETLSKLYYGKARMNFNLLDSENNTFDIRTLSDMAYGYDFCYRFKYIYSDETTDENYSDWQSVYNMLKNEDGYYYLDLVYGNAIGLFVELGINVTDYSTGETITYAYSTYSFSLLKGARDGLIYWFDGENGHGAIGEYDKFNNIGSSDVFIYDSNGNIIHGVTSGQDVDFDFGAGINSIIDAIKSSFSFLYESISSVSGLFAVAFSWLPDPIPQLIIFIFCAMAIFALIRIIRGH